MSLLDFILDNQLIVISIAAALVPLILAFVYVVIRRVRNMLKKRARRKAEVALQASIVAQERRAEAAARREQMVSAEAPADLTPAAQTAVAPGQPIMPGVEASEQTETEETEGDEDEKEEGDETSDKMQDLLASVFVDEEAEAHMAVLLSGTQNPDIHELVQLGQSVAAQLRAWANG
jgi:hypothetical protein